MTRHETIADGAESMLCNNPQMVGHPAHPACVPVVTRRS